MSNDLIIKRVEEIKRVVEEGKVVRISGMRVRKPEYKTTRRGVIDACML
jgi:hypothetical protein